MLVTDLPLVHLLITQSIALVILCVWIMILYHKQYHTKKLSFSDPLTKLYNRAGFHYHISKSLSKIKKQKISTLTLFLIDIDNFKTINDTKGHLVGDECLIQFTKKLLANEHIQKRKGIVSRLGGDEFVIIIENIDPVDLNTVSSSLLNSIKQPIYVSETNEDLQISISIGVSTYNKDKNTTSSLLKAADIALYNVKELGKNGFSIHDSSMDDKIKDLVKYESIITHFIKTKDFNVEYQPIVDLQSKTVIGAEALFRGNPKLYPNLNIDKLFKMAEKLGIINELGLMINDRILQDTASIIDTHPNFVVSINISVIQIEQSTDINWLIQPIKRYNIPPQNISIEITESTFMHKFNQNVKLLKEIKDVGIQISLDDFGTGYSSMLYIQELPVDRIKIDQSFINDFCNNNKTQEIVKTILLLTKKLNMISCAEGVETEQQLKALKALGCGQIQGFVVNKSLPLQHLLQKIS